MIKPGDCFIVFEDDRGSYFSEFMHLFVQDLANFPEIRYVDIVDNRNGDFPPKWFYLEAAKLIKGCEKLHSIVLSDITCSVSSFFSLEI